MKKLLSFLLVLSIFTNIHGQSWLLAGNAGTNPPTEFLGTTDDKDVVFKRYGTIAGRIRADNISFGVQSLASLTSGTYNSALGVYAMFSNTTGSHNNANGYSSLGANTTGSNNTAIGSLSLAANTTASGNTAIGNYALSANTTGGDNSSFGNQSMFGNTTGTENSAFGLRALVSNTTGSYNTGLGSRALYYNTTGSSNTAFGYYALQNNTTADYNTSIGGFALNGTTTGYNNLALGYGAGYYNTTGYNNVYLGFGTGYGITTGNSNTIIGAGVTGLSSSLSNTIILADGDGVQRLHINSSGNAGIGTTSPAARLDVQGGVVKIGSMASMPSGYKLYVDEGILTEKVKVAVEGGTYWADYVFEKDYKLRSLSEVESFIRKNKHLPGIPSASEVKKDGIDLGAMDAKLLEKIEELTLYLLEMKKEIDLLKKQNESLKSSSTSSKK